MARHLKRWGELLHAHDGNWEKTVCWDFDTPTLLLGSLFKVKFSLEEPCMSQSDCACKTAIPPSWRD